MENISISSDSHQGMEVSIYVGQSHNTCIIDKLEINKTTDDHFNFICDLTVLFEAEGVGSNEVFSFNTKLKMKPEVKENLFNFQTAEFAISTESFHFLRNGFNYKTLNSHEVKELILEKGRQVNNWLLILLIGIGLVGFSIYYSYTLFFYVTDNETSDPIYIESFVIPIIPMFLGLYSLFISLTTGPILRMVLHSNKSRHFPLAKTKKEGKIETLLLAIAESHSFKSKFRNHL